MPSRTLEELLRCAGSAGEPFDVRDRAIRELGELGDARAAPALVDLLADPTIQPAGDRCFALRLTAEKALVALGAAAVPALRRAVSDPRDVVRRAVVQVADGIGGGEAMDVLVAALSDGTPAVRWMAAGRLGGHRAAIAVPSLIARLRDEHPAVRATAVWALAEINRAGALPAIAELVDDDADLGDGITVGDRAAIALVRLGDREQVARVIGLLGRATAENDLAHPCLGALTAIGTPEARAAVERWRANRP